MKLNISAENVPFQIDMGVFLTKSDVKSWKKVPWSHYSKDMRPEHLKEKITDLGRLRFLEGWLYLQEGELFWAKSFNTWFESLKKFGEIQSTRECEGCVGSFYKIMQESQLKKALPGYWVYEGAWFRVYDEGNYKQSGIPPSMCRIGQIAYNRRLTIQRKFWGVSESKLQKGLESVATEQIKRAESQIAR